MRAAVLGCLAVCSAAIAQQPADLSSTLETLRAQERAPALAGGIIKQGVITGLGVSGVRSMSETDQQPATLEDRWPVGSCTKPMTRFMIGRLVERGVLTLDTVFTALFPDVAMRDEYKTVKLGLALAHKAGLQAYTRIGPRMTPEVFDQTGSRTAQRARFAGHVLGLEPAAKPGTEFVYSNAGYCVVAAAAEAKTGKSWEQLIADEVFAPLGMASSVAGVEREPEQQPRGHRRTPDGFVPAPGRMGDLAVMAPAGGVKVTIADFARFAGAYADVAAGRAVGGLSAATAAKIAESGPADQGLASAPNTFFGGDGQHHAAFAVWPEQRVAIVVTTNAGDSDEFCAAVIEGLRAKYLPDVPSQSAPKKGAAGGGKRFGFTIRAEESGMAVDTVEAGSIAEKAGLRSGDVIKAMNGKAVGEMEPGEVRSMVGAAKLSLTVEREGKTVELTLVK